jgi:hypothetical protein
MKLIPLIVLLAVLGIAGCASPARPTTAPASTIPVSDSAAPSSPAASSFVSPSASPGELASGGALATPEPIDSGGSTTAGDIPDNAVFLRYSDATNGFSIKYVEGWQVAPQPGGVLISDKDSSETVMVLPGVTDIATYISGTDLPALQATASFSLQAQDQVTVGSQQLNHLLYSSLAPPDPVTGKQVPSTVDRYYVPGANGIAIVSLSTPNGVDNVDAFREMITSFKWS